MQQVLLHDPDFTLDIKMLNQYSNNYCIPPPKTKTNVHHSLSKRSKHKLNFWICTFITVKKKKVKLECEFKEAELKTKMYLNSIFLL